MSAYDLVASQKWAITEDGFREVVAIARRDVNNPDLIRALEARNGEPLENTYKVTVRDGVATIPIRGPMFRHANLLTRISGATSTGQIATDFSRALDDPEVAGIVLDVDSPGGAVAGIGELAGLVRSARGVKPVVAYVGNLGASAAYWVASGAERVVAAPSAMLGSIGVIITVERRADGEKEPVTVVSKQSPDKYHDPETRRGQDKLQAVADKLADVFVADVAANRGVTPADVLARFGQGDILIGADAVAAGLADEVGTYEGVLRSLAAAPKPPPKPSTPGRRPAATANASPKGTAMSAENETPQAGDATAELEALRKQLAAAQQAEATAKAAAKEAVDARLATTADAELDRLAAVLTPHERSLAKEGFLQAVTDDHYSPVAGKPAARLEALRAAYGGRKPHNLAREVGASDDSHKVRALASDPADDVAPESHADDAAREERRKQNKAHFAGKK